MKILLIGSSGAGKTTFARELGKDLGLPILHLDTIWHADDYSEAAAQRFQKAIRNFMDQHENWLIDGNYNASMPMRLAEADIVVWFQISRWRAIWRVVRRSLVFRCNRDSRPEMPNAFTEHFDKEYLDFISFVWQFPKAEIPQIQSNLAQFSGKVYVIKGRRTRRMALKELLQLSTRNAK